MCISVSYVIKRYWAAKSGARDSEVYLAKISENIEPDHTQQWTEQITQAQRERLSDPKAMDKLEATLTRGLSSIFVIVPINSSIAGPTQAEQ